jgi:mono/diheme cytochrome c family protein
MNINKSYSLLIAGSTVASLLLSGCNKNPLSPGVEYMPDMYRGPALETYSETKVNGQLIPTAFQPVAGSIARGFEPYQFPNTPEGYEAAGITLKNPLTNTTKAEEDGKVIFTKYCIHCHGEKGDGVGSIKVKGEPFPVPSYYDDVHKLLPDGKMFHTLHFGKGLMGGHASQLNKQERWEVVAYVNKLQREGLGEKDASTTGSIQSADTTKVMAVKVK